MSKRKAPRSRYGWVSQEAWDAALASKGVVLVTVHGTGDGDTTDAGTRWWQIGSDFIRRVGAEQPLSGTPITVLPFHWSGANSDFDRYQSSKVLNRALACLRSQLIRHHVLAHSHGGNVVQNAFQYHGARNVERTPICTYGAPFFARRRSISSICALAGNSISFFLIMLAVVLLLKGFSNSAYILKNTIPNMTEMIYINNSRLRIASVLWISFNIIPLLINIRYAAIPIYNKMLFLQNRRKVNLVATFSQYDEVLRLLPQIAKLTSVDFLTTSGTRRQIYQSVGSFAVILTLLTGAVLSEFVRHSSSNSTDLITQLFIFNSVVSVFSFALYGLFLILGIILAYTLAGLFASIVNNGVLNTLRKSAFGADHDYLLVSVKSHSDSIPTHLIVNRNIELGGITEALRNSITNTFYSNVIMDQSNDVHSSAFTVWRELNHGLYHNAYFRDDEVIALTAKIIAEKLPKAPAR